MSYQGLRSLLPKKDLYGFLVLALILVVVLPLSLDIFRLNLVGKYLTYAFVAVGLVLCWGYGGIFRFRWLRHGDVFEIGSI
jgi:urea transport system permease protein